MMRVILILVCLSVGGCKKEKLSNDYSYLFGKWHWSNTYKNEGQPGFTDITPTSDGNNYTIEISNKCVKFFKNDKEEKRRRIKEFEILPPDNDTSKTTFIVYLTKKDGLSFEYFPVDNYINVLEYPYSSPAGDGITYQNFFKK